MAEQSSKTEDDDCKESSEITKEETNYLRIANLLLKFAPPVVREKFDKEFNPGGLQTYLNMACHKTLQSLNKKRVINKKQWDLLFPVGGKATSSTFDLSLMIVLIRHLSTIKIEDSLPQSTDTDLGADLSRLKYYRNKLTHPDADGTLTDDEFGVWWNDISQAVIRLSDESYVHKCSELKGRKLDDNDREILKELRNIEKSNDPVPKGLKHVHVKTIEEWETMDESVYETRAMKNLVEMITKEDIVMVIGSPGCGKTTAIHHVALQLQQQTGYDIVPAVSASDIGQFYNPDQNQVFVFDDVCGKYSVERQPLNDWKKQSDNIKKIIDDKHVKILISCRSYMFAQFKNVTILCSTVCDFLSSEYALTGDERFEIAKSHLTEDEAEKVKKLKVFDKYDFFPLICSVYAKKRSGDIEQFFSSPYQVIREELTFFMEDDDQTIFATLILFVIFNNIITDEMLSKKLIGKLNEISAHFEMSKVFSLQVVKEQLNHLTKSYAQKKSNQYSIIHDKLFDILVCFCGEHFFDLIVEHCHADILRDRFQFESVDENQEYLITIPEGKEMAYIEKVFEHFTADHFDTVFENRQMKYEVYRLKVMQFIKEHNKAKRVCLSLPDEKVSLFFTVLEQGYSDILEMLIDMKYDVNMADKRSRTPLYIAADGGYIDCVKLLLNNGADPNICGNYDGKYPLHIASYNGHSEIVKLLVCNKADPNVCRTGSLYKGQTPLHIASQNGHTKVVELLLCNKADPNVCLTDGEDKGLTSLHIASNKGHTEIVELLLYYKADPNVCREDLYYKGHAPLHIASDKGHTKIVGLLLSYKADPNVCREDGYYKGQTPLHIASDKGHTKIVGLLLSYKADPNVCRTYMEHDKETPLYIASVKGHISIVSELLNNNANLVTGSKAPLYAAVMVGNTEIVTLLLEHKHVDVNDCDKFQQSPLFIASQKCYIQIVELLLKHKFNPDMISRNGLSPLFIASKLGHTEIVSLLLQYQCDMSVCDQYNQSPLFVASRNRHYETVVKLLEYNSDPLLCNVNEFSPLTVSLLNTNKDINKDIVILLLKHCLQQKKITESECCFLIAILNEEIKVVEDEMKGFDYSNFVLGGNVSPLFIGCCCNNKIVVRLLLEDMAKKNTLSKKVTTLALLAACAYNFVEIVGLLFEYGSDPDGDNETRNPPLCIAAEYGHTHIAEALIEYNCNPDLCNKDNVTPLYIASVMNHPDIVRLLLKQKCNINWCSKEKKTPLYIASLLNHNNVVEMLLEYNCNVNLCDINNQSPLFVASQMNHTETTRQLLESNCDVNLCDKYKQSPLHIATEHLNVDIVKMLLEHNCNPNLCDKYNRTALCLILEKRFYKDEIKNIIKLLIEHYTDTNLCNYKQESPLHLIVCANHPDGLRRAVMKLLLQYKGDPNLRNSKGQTALYLATKRGSFDMVKLLLDGNANPHIPDTKNKTSLHAASKSDEDDDDDIVQLLLEHHCNPDICDNKRRTPLYVAVLHGKTKFVETLLGHQCNPNLCDEDHCSPLFIASKYGNFDIVDLLLQHKCDPFICNNDGDLPWLVAMEWGHDTIAEYILANSTTEEL